jgi:Cdc6-like AAA superfamily ATPase
MILSKTETIQNELEVVKNDTKHTRHEGDLAKHKELTAWISPTNFPADHSDLLGRRQEGTGQWFLEAPKFKQWLSRPNETLFCPGMPGAGKTMLATIAISHLLQTVQNDFTGVAYVYCNYKKQNEQSASSLLAAILKQLVQAYPLLTEPVKRLHALHKERETRPSIVELFDTLQTALTSLSTVYIVVDALDECRDDVRRSFLAKLRDLQTKIDLRSMVTSRHIPNIVNDLKSSLRLEVRASAGDVAEFVAGQIQQLPKCIQNNPSLRAMVQQEIVKAADGMQVSL